MTRPTPPRTTPFTRAELVLYALGFLAFFLFGLVQAGYGPAFPALGREYGQPVTVVGVVASLHFAGSAVGTLLLGPLLTRLSLRSSLMVAALGLLMGLLTVTFSPTWGLLLVGATLGGLAYGMLSAGFNLAFAELGPGPSNLVNGLFGVGSVVSPILVTLLARGSHGPPFLLMAVMAAGLAVGVRLLWPKPDRTGPDLSKGPSSDLADRLTQTAAPEVSKRVLTLFGLCFLLYVGIEAGYGNWATTYFARLGAGQPELLTSFYWLALTAGRFASAALGSRFSPLQTLSFATGGAILGSAVMVLGGLRLAPYGLVLSGFCIAPIFSAQLAWFTRSQPPRLAPYMLTLGSVGGAVLPALTGLALPRLGVISVPLAPMLIAALLMVCVLLLHRQLATRRLVPELTAS
ncbi:MFS transporter [Deinococcus radiomollis]|uniref:MFS transporter n=1 Tax=Deinococcus radiomollis TaxID=468916 RepID=UPI0038924059